MFAPHMKSCLELARDLTGHVNFDWMIRWNESLVHRARMGMTKEFLLTDHSHMMWIDADIEFQSEDVGKLYAMNVDIAVGVYRMKTEDSKYAAWQNGKLITSLDKLDKVGNLAHVDYAGTGFMMIKRQVLEKLSELVPKYENEYPDIAALYMTPIHNGILESEDYHFCRIAREAGIKILMDTSIRLKHWGITAYE